MKWQWPSPNDQNLLQLTQFVHRWSFPTAGRCRGGHKEIAIGAAFSICCGEIPSGIMPTGACAAGLNAAVPEKRIKLARHGLREPPTWQHALGHRGVLSDRLQSAFGQ
jgi:hypothetical protein